jgi:AcrR family transcriptional regulator
MSGNAIRPSRQQTDRRASRTRAALHQALMSLILERRYETITIKQICDVADVGRSTFYAHYASKDELKRDGMERLRLRLLHEGRGKPGAFAFSRTLFEHARSYLHVYRVLSRNRGGAVALRKIREILRELMRQDLAAYPQATSVIPRELAIEHLVGAYMSLLTWWLDGGAKMPPEQIDAAFRRLTLHGVGSPH